MCESLKQINGIPKIIHQIWIGPKPAPLSCMKTWLYKNPDFEYIFWTEAEFIKRNIQFEAQEKIDMISEYAGKTDIMRLEILSRFGGIFIDADSICIEPIGELFERLSTSSGFATFENENSRKGLIANGNLAVYPKHPLLRDMLDWILSTASDTPIRTLRAWASVGPVLLTRFLETGKYRGFTVLPSYYFLPIHFTGDIYMGHRKVYAHQLWGSNYGSYDTELENNIPGVLLYPSSNVLLSIDLNTLHISSNGLIYNIKKTLDSIKSQQGLFSMDIVFIFNHLWVYERYYRDRINEFERTSRFIRIRVVLKENSDTIFLNNSYIEIHPMSILYPNTIEEVMRGSVFSAPIYTEDSHGKIITTGESFLVRLCCNI
jgi:hypothetical protein